MTSEPSHLLPLFTLTVWLGCLTVGVIGICVPYPRPPTSAAQLPPVIARLINVSVAHDSSPPPPALQPTPSDPAPDIAPPPSTPPVDSAPPQPSLATVAVPAPQIAFALPMPTPARIVPAQQAVPRARTSPAPATPPIAHITFGEGEGDQPPPEYPREAAVDRQQGTVVVRFTVAADGTVQSADASSPCPWPLLNQAALRAVRETWRFTPGPPRTYEVSIQFQLKHR